MKQILKSLKAHRAKSAALFTEIVIVTIIGWIVVMPTAILTTDSLIPANYDYQRLVHIQFSSLNENSEGYDSTRRDPLPDYRRLLAKIRQRPDVESATFSSYQAFESTSSSSFSMTCDSTYGFTGYDLDLGVRIVSYMPKTDFFKTYGILTPDGHPFIEPDAERGYIINRSVAKGKYRDKNPVGLHLLDYDSDDPDDRPSQILAITQDTPYRKAESRSVVAFKPIDNDEIQWTLDGITARVKDGVSPRRFVELLTTEISDYRHGNTYLTHPTAYTDRREAAYAGNLQKLTKSWIILAFFLVNVLLGVAGTFYIQCRSRIMDAGVMRAFGATRSEILGSIIGEACLTTITAWAAGSIIYIAYELIAKPEFEYTAEKMVQILNPMWYDQAPERFAIVGVLILGILLICALLGAWLPARRVASVPPVDALRDE